MNSSSKFLYWINEPIYMTKGVTNLEKRKHAVYFFCKEGLIPFVRRHGYVFSCSEDVLTKRLLTLLFYTWQRVPVKPIHQECEFITEQYDFYCHTLETRDWDDLWSKWGSLQDFEEGSFAYSLRYTLPSYVWSWLDLYSSKASIKLHAELGALHDEDTSKGRDDLYLQETNSRDYQDRHWH